MRDYIGTHGSAIGDVLRNKNNDQYRVRCLMERHKRMCCANELLRCISRTGRKFFARVQKPGTFGHAGNSCFMLAENGRVWYLDHYTNKLIYTHYNGEWRGFTNGGTMRRLVQGLRDFIMTGKRLCGDLGPWPERHGNDRWGYGDEMELVRRKACELEII